MVDRVNQTPTHRFRIGIDAHSLVELRTGVATYVANLVRGLGIVAQDESIGLYLHTMPGEPLPFREVRVSPGRLWTTLRLSAHFLRSQAPEVMLYPAHTIPLHSPARNVVTIHDLAWELFPDHFRLKDRIRLSRTTRSAVRRADHIIAVSAATRADLVSLLDVPEDRISVVHHGYDASHFRPQDPARVHEIRARYDLQRPYIIAVGTLQSRKNHVTLIGALKLLIERGLDIDLVISGAKGWLYDEIFATVERFGLEDRVRFLGYVPYDHLPALYAGARAGALVSLYEGFGLPILEALACGTPMLISNVSSLPEVGGDAVLTCVPHDVDEVAGSLERLVLEDSLREQLLARAPSHLSRFSWVRTAEETLGILNGLA